MQAEVSSLMYRVFILSIQLAGPPLVISMLVGMVIAVFQAATQIHEQTLTFVPKLLTIGIVLLLRGGAMMAALQDLFIEICSLIATG